VSDLQADECYAELAKVALAEVASIDSQLVRNIAKRSDEDVWRLNENEVVSVGMRVRSPFEC
jgi:hypothetical protein